MRDYDKNPIVIKDNALDSFKFIRVVYIILFILEFHYSHKHTTVSYTVFIYTLYKIQKYINTISWRKDAYIYFYNDFIEIKGEYTKTLKLNNIEKINNDISYLSLFSEKRKYIFRLFFILSLIIACGCLYAYYVSKFMRNYIPPTNIVSEMVLSCILIIIYWSFIILFAFRLKNGLNLNVLKDSIVIFTLDDMLDIYFLNKKEIDKIKEYLSQRTKFKNLKGKLCKIMTKSH